MIIGILLLALGGGAVALHSVYTVRTVYVEGNVHYTEDEIKEFCRTHMAKHKTPRYVRFVNSFPMNAAGKILKYKMREEATERFGLEGAAGIDTAQTAEQVKR